MNRVLLFCQLGVATWEVVWNIDAWFHSDDHAWSQDGVPLYSHCVVGVHTKVVTDVVRIETVHGLQRERENQILAQYFVVKQVGTLGNKFGSFARNIYIPGVFAFQRAYGREHQALKQLKGNVT